MADFITFGEMMIRLNPEGYLRITQAKRFEASYSGGEVNVAVGLSCFGMKSAFVSKVPDNDVGQAAINYIRQYGVDTSMVLRGGPRLGVYYLEKGASQRPSKVIYDRVGSSISLAKCNEFDWAQIFDKAKWFHVTGITPALGGELPEICLEACKTAKAMGLIVSCDLNYRAKLWSKEEAGRVMATLMPYVDVLISNEEDSADVFGIKAKDTDVIQGELSHEGYISVAKQIHESFGVSTVAITLRGSLSASDNDWSGMLYQDNNAYFSPTYRIHLVDRVGGGDSFGASLIYALSNNYDPQKAINFAVAGSCLKQATEFDFSISTVNEVEKLANGDVSGRVQR